MAWGRDVIATEAVALQFQEGVNLGSNEKLSRAYESTTAFSKLYLSDDLPNDDELMLDAEKAVSLLGQLYRAAELGRSPETEPPEVREARAVFDAIARPSGEKLPKRGQGFGLTAEERKAVEVHAMTFARAWLDTNGYENIRDVSATHSCDYWATKNGVDHYVEVKGTTAGFGSILLTANEVELHRTLHPDNVLLLVHSIDLKEMRTQAVGGKLVPFERWDIETATLRPLSYACDLSDAGQ